MNMRFIVGIMVAATWVGCAAEVTEPPPPDPTAVTWVDDVGPFVAARCGGCHVDGGVAEMPLDRFEAATMWAPAMRAAIESRTMPPFYADGSGACGDLRDEGWLSDEELALVGRWIDGGMPRGEGVEPTFPLPSHLERVDREVAMERAFTSSLPWGDEYRCFVLDPGIDEDAFLTAYEVVPGEPSIVHHVIAFSPADPDAEAQARAMDGADGRDGYPCYGDAAVPATFVLEWGPGQGAVTLPEGTGLRLPAGRSLVLQVHYSTRGEALPDRTAVRLTLAPSVDTEAHTVVLFDSSFSLAPRLAETRVSFSTRMFAPMTIHAALPHMHTLGRSIRVSVRRGGGDAPASCLLDVPRWDFDWQRQYGYATPVSLAPDDVVDVDCVFDTRERDAPVTFGWGTADEMCLAFLYATY